MASSNNDKQRLGEELSHSNIERSQLIAKKDQLAKEKLELEAGLANSKQRVGELETGLAEATRRFEEAEERSNDTHYELAFLRLEVDRVQDQ